MLNTTESVHRSPWATLIDISIVSRTRGSTQTTTTGRRQLTCLGLWIRCANYGIDYFSYIWYIYWQGTHCSSRAKLRWSGAKLASGATVWVHIQWPWRPHRGTTQRLDWDHVQPQRAALLLAITLSASQAFIVTILIPLNYFVDWYE